MKTRSRPGFTLIELLVVVGIIAILIAMLVPAIMKVRETANRMECASHLATMGNGIKSFLVSNGNYFPTGGGDVDPFSSTVYPYAPRTFTSAKLPAVGATQDFGWMYQILPYAEHENLWKTTVNPGKSNVFSFTSYVDPDGDLVIASTPVSLFFCPSRRNPAVVKTDLGVNGIRIRAVNDYAGNCGAWAPRTDL